MKGTASHAEEAEHTSVAVNTVGISDVLGRFGSALKKIMQVACGSKSDTVAFPTMF